MIEIKDCKTVFFYWPKDVFYEKKTAKRMNDINLFLIYHKVRINMLIFKTYLFITPGKLKKKTV